MEISGNLCNLLNKNPCESVKICGQSFLQQLASLWTLNLELRLRRPLWAPLNFERATALLNFEPAVLLPYLWALCYLCDNFFNRQLKLPNNPYKILKICDNPVNLWAKPWTLNFERALAHLNLEPASPLRSHFFTFLSFLSFSPCFPRFSSKRRGKGLFWPQL